VSKRLPQYDRVDNTADRALKRCSQYDRRAIPHPASPRSIAYHRHFQYRLRARRASIQIRLATTILPSATTALNDNTTGMNNTANGTGHFLQQDRPRTTPPPGYETLVPIRLAATTPAPGTRRSTPTGWATTHRLRRSGRLYSIRLAISILRWDTKAGYHLVHGK